MFYINRNTRISFSEFTSLHIVPSLIVFFTFMLVAIISWNAAKNSVNSEKMQVLQRENNSISSDIKQRAEIYQDILRGGSGLFLASDDVSRSEWRTYLDSYKIGERYPGIEGVGYIELIPKSSLPSHINQIRKEGYEDYTVFPAGDRNPYSSVVYIEPFSGDNLKIIGYDMYSEDVRKSALNDARDSGNISITDIVTLKREIDSEDKQPSFIMYMPIYSKVSTELKNIDERRAQIKGFVFAPFRATDFINSVVENDKQNYGYVVYKQDSDKERLIYKSNSYDNLIAAQDNEILTQNIEISNTDKLRIEGVVSPEVISADSRNRPSSLLWAGILLSFFTAGFLYLLLSNRARSLNEKEDKDIQDAKDELLALASHQLRTPATGVKQYVGMLREGFAGKLTPEQMNLVERAYQSNERQLGTIKEMLLVARADAGNLKMEFKRFNLTREIKDIIEEQLTAIKTQTQKIRVIFPKPPVYIVGDSQYIRMALENILSNATKYTNPGGKISVSLSRKSEHVLIVFQDNGVGVADKDVDLLFKKFSRIPNDLTNRVSGSGIGLYLTKGIIDLHKGSIEFDSTVGKGSKVTITLPITQKK